MSDQFTQQLKRQAAAHTDHLNEVLSVQQQELTRKHDNERELQLSQVKLAHSEELAKWLGMARGIQQSVRDRADVDHLAREVRNLWMAAHSLIDGLRSNQTAHLPWEEQRRDLSSPLALLSQVTRPEDEFVKTVIETIPKDVLEKGVLPQGAIKVFSRLLISCFEMSTHNLFIVISLLNKGAFP